MKPFCRELYPIDLGRLASDVARRGIDIAPTRLTWERLARCLATAAGEQGRNAFHRMAAVWPDYCRHDSELCYNRALRKTGDNVGLGWLALQLKKHGIDINHQRYRGKGPLVKYKTKKLKTKDMQKIDLSHLLATQRNGRRITGRCNLTDLLLNLFPQHQVLTVLDKYLMGYNSFRTGQLQDAAIFWQVNEQKQVVNAKLIHYRRDGHRDKKFPPLVMFPGNGQCLFGLHLLNGSDRDSPVAIVESEKSALVMAIVNPEYVWMACGSMNNLNESFLKPLRKRNITLFPDVDQVRDRASGKSISFALWKDKARQLAAQRWHITVNDELENTVNTAQRLAKIDIADLFIERAKERFMNQHMR